MQTLFGYARISTDDQYVDRQLTALEPFHIPTENLYIDKQSGKDFDRPAYHRLLDRLTPGDLLIVKSIDRLGRNYTEIMEQWRYLVQNKRTDVKILDMPLLDTSLAKDLIGTLISDLVLQILSFVAQQEREVMLTRQAEGIAAAKARGVVFGRKPKPLPDDFEDVCRRWREGELSAAKAAKLCGICVKTLYEKSKGLI